jgi:hypothetical protein
MRYLAAVLMAGVALLGCDDDDDDDDDIGDDGVIDQRQMSTTVVGLSGFPQISGTSTVTWIPNDQEFTATATITNDVQGMVRPWHVHFGTCATGGAIVGSDAQYPRLTVGANGTATATVTIRYELGNVPYHINFHKSEAEFDTIIACGDLVVSSGGGGGGGGGGPY